MKHRSTAWVRAMAVCVLAVVSGGVAGQQRSDPLALILDAVVSAENPVSQSAMLEGVRFHPSFRNRTTVQTHPIDRDRPCVLKRTLNAAVGKKTRLHIVVSHHPHGDFRLVVRANDWFNEWAY